MKLLTFYPGGRMLTCIIRTKNKARESAKTRSKIGRKYAIAQYLQQVIMDLSAVLVAELRIKQNIELSNKKCNNLKEALRNKQSKRSRSDNDLPDNQISPRKKSSYIILAFN
ncbi:unnamed protein product [Rhizophagus irregularis]|nr:unnamed protein product [Rhizophagus irregularis]